MVLLKNLVYTPEVILEAVYQPLLDIFETDEDVIIEIDLPGVEIGDVLIKVFEDLVIVEGIKREIKERRRIRYICMERNLEAFRRIIRLPVLVNSMAGRAVYSEGVLKMTFPKVKEKVFKIKIETGGD